ncbi:MAG: DUF11 domain-containing protein, partial [Candidatus Sacchiramonaceae bacterium]|nr:DUF11 domain-containing protein [Candidatus Saccharimonadaceae bacterium]
MKKILNLIKDASLKSKFLVSVLALGLAVPGIILAWGPDRPTFTMEKPADHVTFNSITNAKGKYFHGDERNFVLIKEKGSGEWINQVDLKPGKTYEVFNYFHNNASTTLNDAKHNYAGIAKNATMKVNIPATVKAGERAQFLTSVSADNAKPQTVWDQAWGQNNTGGPIGIRIVPSSATIYSAGKVNGAKLPDTLFSTGTKLGYDSLNGELPGCLPFAGYVRYEVTTAQPNFEISKKVSKAGQNSWQENISVKPGEKVDYLIEYKNTGTTRQSDVVLKDKLPEGMSYVAGSSLLANANNKFTPTKVSDGVASVGYNIGTYNPNSNAFLRFTATAPSKDQIKECGKDIKLTNTASVSTTNGAKSDTADITVRKDCEPTPKKPGVSIEKTVNGKEKITIEANKEFTYELVVKNTGEVDLKDVNVTDKAPANVQFISTDKGTISNNALSYKIAELKVGQSQTIKIKARATKEGISAKNTACVDTPTVPGSPDDCDDAEIETPKPKPVVYSCNVLSITQISRTKFEFNTDYTVQNTDFKGVKYIIKDASGKVATETTVNNGTKLTYDNQNTGKYTVEAIVITGKGEATNAKCKKQFQVVQEDKPGISIQKTVNGKENIKIDVNKEFTYELIVRNTGNVDLKNAVVTDNAPENVKFISADKGTIKDNKFTYQIPTLKVGASETIKIKAIATKEGISAKNTAWVDTPTITGNPDDCDDANIEVPPKPPVVPEEPTPEEPTPEEPTPETPPELPQTGMTEAVSALIGAGSITAALGYYIASRRQLL